VQSHITKGPCRRLYVSWHCQVNKNNMSGNFCIFNLLHSQRIIRTCCSADCQITFWKKLQTLSIIDPVAALRDCHNSAAVLPHCDRYICSCFLKSQSSYLPHFAVSNNHTGFSLDGKSLIFQTLYSLVDYRAVGSGKAYLGFYFLCSSNRHAE